MQTLLHKKIFSLSEQLTESEQQLVKIILEYNSALLTLTASEIAEKAGVSKATASRFFQRLGYGNFSDLKKELKQELHEGSPLYELEERKLNANSQFTLQVIDHLNNDLNNIKNTFENIDLSLINTSSVLVAEARKVYVVGFRNGSMLAQYCWTLLLQLRPDVINLPPESNRLVETLSDLTSNDLLIIMDFRRRTTQLDQLLKLMEYTKTKTVIFTDDKSQDKHNVPPTSIVLSCYSNPSLLFDSYSSAMSLINYFCGSVYKKIENSAHKRLEKIELLHDIYDDLSN